MKNFLILTILIFCSQTFAFSPSVIYGSDDRQDSYEASWLHQKLAESTAAKIPKNKIRIKGATAEIGGIPLHEKMPNAKNFICKKEKFSHQLAPATCSGFLVKNNILVTAGHCMTSEDECKNAAWVFNFKVSDAHQSAVSVNATEVVSCKRIIKRKNSFLTGMDFAVIELDRKLDKKPLKLASSLPTEETPLFLVGHPSGLPQKIVTGGKAKSIGQYSFTTNLDSFRGNSGSAVLNAKTGEVYGVLVSGNRDYKLNSELGCMEVNEIREGRSGERVNTYQQFQDYL